MDYEIGDSLEDNLYPSTKLEEGEIKTKPVSKKQVPKIDFDDLMLDYNPYENFSNNKATSDDITTNDNVKSSNSVKNRKIEYFGKESVINRGGLVLARKFKIDINGYFENICDISVSGLLGWVTVIIPKIYKSGNKGVLSGRIWAPKGVEVFIRRPIPVPNPLTKE